MFYFFVDNMSSHANMTSYAELEVKGNFLTFYVGNPSCWGVFFGFFLVRGWKLQVMSFSQMQY